MICDVAYQLYKDISTNRLDDVPIKKCPTYFSAYAALPEGNDL
jgi:hypothetical protein